MLLTLKRQWFTETTTSGILLINSVYSMYTLEDVARPFPVKIPKKTCLWPGDYRIMLDQSQRFGRIMPHIMDVALFTGIRIHPGNVEADTEGCILVGYERGPDTVWRSREAFEDLFKKMQEAIDNGECLGIDIINHPV